MTQAGPAKRRGPDGGLWPWLVPAIAAALAAMSLGIFLYQAPKVSRQVEGLRSANTDNIQWTILQLEVEFLELQLAARAAGSGHDAALDRLRQRFDIFFSRIVTLDHSAPYARVLREIPASALFGRIRDHAGHLLPFIDAPDTELMQALPVLEAEIHAMRPLVRQFSNQGNLAVSLWAENARLEMARVLRELVAVAVVFFSSTTVLTFVFWRLYRINRQRAYENLMTSARLEAVVGTSQDAIIVTDEQERIIGFNRAAETMFAIPRHLARGRWIGDLVLTSEGGPLALNGATSARVERLQMVGRDAAGRSFPVEVYLGTALREGTPIHVCFLRNISDRLAAEEDLRSSRDKALAGERAKAHFLAVMSHEMRTPLNGILGVIELLRSGGPEALNRGYLDILQSSGEILLGHVNDVLDLTEIESMGINLTDQPFDLDALLDEVVRTIRPAADMQAIGLSLQTAPRPLGWFRGDPVRLRQILINLISNAIKFTDEGEVMVEATAAADPQSPAAGRHRIEIQVSDTGKGIAQSQLARIFEDFVRLEDNIARQTEGTGLGLGIVKRLVAAMGGTLGVESIEGEGSLFWVTLPLAPAERPCEDGTGKAEVIRAKPMSVLLVEDNTTNRFILREMLQRDGHHVAEAGDGRQGIAMAAARRFDLILMDINMPVMGGLRATEEIRRGGGLSAGARIVALTAHIFDHEQMRYKEAGLDDIVIKPLSWEALRRLMAGKPAAFATGEEAARQRGDEPVLDLTVLNSLAATLGPEQLRALLDQFVTEGLSALSYIEQFGQGTHQALRDRLHGFAGAAATFGARRLFRHLSRIEDRGVDIPKDEVKDLAHTLMPVWSSTLTEVAAFRASLAPPPDGPQEGAPETPPRRPA